MSKEAKVRMYKTRLKPIMTYAGERRAGYGQTKILLKTTDMQILRNITESS